MLTALRESCGASQSEAGIILEYLNERYRVTRLVSIAPRAVSPEEELARKERGIDV